MSGRWALRDGQGRRLKTGRRDVPGGQPAIPKRTRWRPPAPDAEPDDDIRSTEVTDSDAV